MAAENGADGSVVIEINADDSNFQRSLNELSNTITSSFGSAIDNAVQRLSEQFRELGSNASGAGNNIGGAFGEGSHARNSVTDFSNIMQNAFGHLIADAVEKLIQKVMELGQSIWQAGVSFESAFTGVMKTVDETANISYADLENQIRDMSKNLPSTVEEISAVAEAAGQLGIKTDDVASFSKTMIDLGNSTNIVAEEAASSLAKFANVTKMSSDQYGNLGAAIVDLGNNYATTERDIVNMATRLAATATTAGINEQGILALSTALSSVGIEAEAGGTAMSTFIKKVQTAVETQSKNLSKYAEIAGMTAEEFSKVFKEDGTQAINAFLTGLGKLDQNGGSALSVLNDMGLKEVRLSNAILALSNAGNLLTRTIETSNTAWEENTALTEEASKRYETTESKIQMLKNAVNDFFISIYQSMSLGFDVGPITEYINTLNSAFQDDGFNGLLDKAQELFDISDSTIEGLKKLAEKLPSLLQAAADAFITLLHSVEEISGDILEKLVDYFFPLLIDGLEWISEHGEVVNTLIRTFIGLWAGEKLANGVKNVGTLVTNIKNFGSVLSGSAGKVNVYLAALQAVVVVGTVLAGAVDSATEKLIQTDKLDSETQAIYDRNEAYKNSIKLAEQNAQTDINTANAVEKWWGQLQNLVDENGNVAGSMSEVERLIYNINEATGLNIEVIDGQIQSYKDLTESVDDYIETMRRKAIVDNYSDAYGEAVANIDEIQENYDNARGKSIVANTQANALTAEVNRLQEEKQKLIDEANELYDKNRIKEGNELMEKAHSMRDTISQYEGIIAQKKEELTTASTQKSIYGSQLEEYKQVIGKVEALLAEQYEETKDIAEQTGQSIKDTANSTVKYLSDEEAKKLHYQAEMAKELVEITEAEYFNRIESIANQLDRETALYQQYTKEVAKGRRKLAEESAKDLEAAEKTIYKSAQDRAKEEIKAVKDNLNDLIDTYKDKYDDVIKLRDQYKKKLMGDSIFTVTTETDQKTGKTYSTYTIENMTEMLKKREEYAKQIAALQKRNISEGLLEELESLDIDQATVFAKQMNKMSDDEWDKLNSSYARLDKITSDIANDRYKSDLDNIQTEFADKATAIFDGMSDDIKNAGMNSIQAYIDGFNINKENAFKELDSAVEEITEKIKNGIADSSVDLSGTLSDIVGDANIGSTLVDNIVSSITEGQDEIEEALQTIFDNTGLDMQIKADVQNAAATASSSGYNAATVVIANQTAASSESSSAPKASGTSRTIDVNLKLTDDGKRIMAEIVNSENKKLQIQGGT